MYVVQDPYWPLDRLGPTGHLWTLACHTNDFSFTIGESDCNNYLLHTNCYRPDHNKFWTGHDSYAVMACSKSVVIIVLNDEWEQNINSLWIDFWDKLVCEMDDSPTCLHWCCIPSYHGFTESRVHQVIVNTLRPRQNGQYFAHNIFKCSILNENFCILIQITLKFFMTDTQ